jgi:hypothetical protein
VAGINVSGHMCKPRHNRLCWLIQKQAEKQSRRRRLKPRETEYIPLLKLTPMALDINRRELSHRAKIIFTSVRNSENLTRQTSSTFPHT